jgi:hypothetical protein
MTRSAVCGRCKSLVEIQDRRWSPHNNQAGQPCPISNSLFIAPVIHRGGGAAPHIEVLSTRNVDCPGCGKPDGAIEIRFRVNGQKAGLN